jgi:uncharacterized phiE125 gp8 family phage protein
MTYPYIVQRAETYPISLQQANAWLGLDIPGFTADDAKVQYLILSACDAFEAYTGLNLHETAYEWVLDHYPTGIPDVRLVSSVESIAYHNGAGYTNILAGTDYYTYRKSTYRMGIGYPSAAALPTLPDRPDAVCIRFTAGFGDGTVPNDVLQAIRAKIREYYDNPGDGIAEKKTLSERLMDRYLEGYAS